MQKIKKAILPVAGFGTRFLPATKAQPKEMLPVVDKPVIQYLVEEAVSAGIEEIIFVTGRGKRAIEEHFDRMLGQTVYATLLKLRVFEVKRLLTLTDLPVKEIARQTGFCHAQHLNNAFRRQERATPSGYRKNERRPR